MIDDWFVVISCVFGSALSGSWISYWSALIFCFTFLCDLIYSVDVMLIGIKRVLRMHKVSSSMVPVCLYAFLFSAWLSCVVVAYIFLLDFYCLRLPLSVLPYSCYCMLKLPACWLHGDVKSYLVVVAVILYSLSVDVRYYRSSNFVRIYCSGVCVTIDCSGIFVRIYCYLL